MAYRKASGRRVKMSLEELLTKARDSGYEEWFINFLETSLTKFAGDFAESAKTIATRMGAKQTGRLIESIYPRSIVFKEGDAKAGIGMDQYGYFVNAGAGRGVTATERRTGVALTSSRTLSTDRTPKPFIDESEDLAHIQLTELLSVTAADLLADIVAVDMMLRVEM